MNDQIFISVIGLIGAIIGGLIASIPNFIQEFKTHKRWLTEKKISYLQDQILEIENSKTVTLKNLHNLFKGKNFADNDDFIYSVPLEVI